MNSVGEYTDAGAVSFGGTQAASANFQSHWSNAEDVMAASIIRVECQKDELNAEVALLREQARILQRERDEALLTIEGLRDQLCADKCRDKAAADGGWANI